jgi:hypothetical protein
MILSSKHDSTPTAYTDGIYEKEVCEGGDTLQSNIKDR